MIFNCFSCDRRVEQQRRDEERRRRVKEARDRLSQQRKLEETYKQRLAEQPPSTEDDDNNTAERVGPTDEENVFVQFMKGPFFHRVPAVIFEVDDDNSIDDSFITTSFNFDAEEQDMLDSPKIKYWKTSSKVATTDDAPNIFITHEKVKADDSTASLTCSYEEHFSIERRDDAHECSKDVSSGNSKPAVVVEDVSVGEDNIFTTFWRNRRPSPGEWMEPIIGY